MQQSRITALSIVATLSVCAAAHAQNVTGQATVTGLVVVDFNAAVLQTAEAKRDLGALQAKYSPRQAQLQKLNDEIESLRKPLSETGEKLSDAERATRAQSLNLKEKQLQRDAEDFRNDTQSESQQAFQRVAQKVYAVLQEYSRQHGYSAVIDRGPETAPVVWYAASGVDITDAVVRAYDGESAASPSGLPDGPSVKSPSAKNAGGSGAATPNGPLKE
jgi:outer membrane protein